jgi:hypothetical protein
MNTPAKAVAQIKAFETNLGVIYEKATNGRVEYEARA